MGVVGVKLTKRPNTTYNKTKNKFNGGRFNY